MFKVTSLLFLFLLFPFKKVVAQSLEINGVVQSDKDVENIHVINKTAQLFTTTNSNGKFKIFGSINDTLIFSSILHKTQILIIDKNVMATKSCVIQLEEFVNELDEITVGKVLTGNLNMDVNNTEGDPPINFYDVGIPGYTGKIATQSERRLFEADHGKFIQIGVSDNLEPQLGINLNKILNRITGRTKVLKFHVEIEEREILMQSIKARLSKDFFELNSLEEGLEIDFFYFCEEDPNFNLRCKNKSDIEIFEFLKEKLFEYKKNLNSNKN